MFLLDSQSEWLVRPNPEFQIIFVGIQGYNVCATLNEDDQSVG